MVRIEMVTVLDATASATAALLRWAGRVNHTCKPLVHVQILYSYEGNNNT